MNFEPLSRITIVMLAILPFHFRAVVRTEASFQEPQKSYKVVSQETYRGVLDLLFPRNEENGDYDFVLRFEPNVEPESQLVIKRAAERVKIIKYTSSSGNIYRKLNDVLAHGGKEDIAEMARLVQIKKTTIEVPSAQLRRWHESLIGSIDQTMKTFEQRRIEEEKGEGIITLDGAIYELWYNQIGIQCSFRILDHDLSDREVTGQFEVVRWMNSVRLDVIRAGAPR